MTAQQLALWCKHGHEMTDDNIRPGRCGEQECKTCWRIHLAAVREWARQHSQTERTQTP